MVKKTYVAACDMSPIGTVSSRRQAGPVMPIGAIMRAAPAANRFFPAELYNQPMRPAGEQSHRSGL
jgi:hypothetical protein